MKIYIKPVIQIYADILKTLVLKKTIIAQLAKNGKNSVYEYYLVAQLPLRHSSKILKIIVIWFIFLHFTCPFMPNPLKKY